MNYIDIITDKKMNKQQFVIFIFFKLDSKWRQLAGEAKKKGHEEFIRELKIRDSQITINIYSTIGLKANTDFMFWITAHSIDLMQELISRLLNMGLGKYLEISHTMLGLIRNSVYAQKDKVGEQPIRSGRRSRYLIVYPFTKTKEWYLLERDIRQEMMDRPIGIGRAFPSISQTLAYSFGLDDNEFIVSYETENLADFQDVVKALRETKARLYTLNDIPVFVGINRTAEELANLLG